MAAAPRGWRGRCGPASASGRPPRRRRGPWPGWSRRPCTRARAEADITPSLAARQPAEPERRLGGAREQGTGLARRGYEDFAPAAGPEPATATQTPPRRPRSPGARRLTPAAGLRLRRLAPLARLRLRRRPRLRATCSAGLADSAAPPSALRRGLPRGPRGAPAPWLASPSLARPAQPPLRRSPRYAACSPLRGSLIPPA